MSEDKKLYLIEAEIEDTEKKLTFASYLKSDYVEKAIVIRLSNDNIVDNIFFSSNNFGTVKWENKSGLIECNRWENEDMAKSSSNLSRRYTSILADGAETMDYAKELIIPDVVDSLADTDLANFLKSLVGKDESEEKIDFSKFHKLSP